MATITIPQRSVLGTLVTGDMVQIQTPGGGVANISIANFVAYVVSTSSFIFNQGAASTVWNINHNLNAYPSITIVDSGGNVVGGDEVYVDSNNITITFRSAFSGTAYLSV